MKEHSAADRVVEWAEAGGAHQLPAWEELPAIPLYMDQVIYCLNESLALFREDGEPLITSSMINNYVKSGVLSHPEKKKYDREHLGALLAVCLLKQVLSIGEIKTLLSGEEQRPELYELFRQVHSEAVRGACREVSERCREGESLKRQALRLAAEANAKRAAAERILAELAKDAAPRSERPSGGEKSNRRTK